MDSKALNHAKGTGEGTVRHNPCKHVGGFRGERDKVPERVVGSSGLRNFCEDKTLEREREKKINKRMGGYRKEQRPVI